MYQAILFDFDGTLAQSLDLWLRGFGYALHEYGLTLADEDILAKYLYKSKEDIAAELKITDLVELESRFSAGLTRAFVDVKLFAGAHEVLSCIQEAGVKIGLVTSAPRLQIEMALDILVIRHFFAVVVTGDDITNYKPHAEPVEKALTALNCPPAKALFVGDHSVDITAGKAAGTATVLFLPAQNARYHDFAKLRETNPDFTFTDHADLEAFLRNIFKDSLAKTGQ